MPSSYIFQYHHTEKEPNPKSATEEPAQSKYAYGERIYRARNLVEKPKPEDAPATRSAIMGRYILNPDIFGKWKTYSLARTEKYC